MLTEKQKTSIENIIKNSKPCPKEFMDVLEKTFKILLKQSPTRC